MANTNARDFEWAIWAIMRRTQIDAACREEYRLLGFDLLAARYYRQARICLRNYLALADGSEHADAVRDALSLALEGQARRN